MGEVSDWFLDSCHESKGETIKMRKNKSACQWTLWSKGKETESDTFNNWPMLGDCTAKDTYVTKCYIVYTSNFQKVSLEKAQMKMQFLFRQFPAVSQFLESRGKINSWFDSCRWKLICCCSEKLQKYLVDSHLHRTLCRGGMWTEPKPSHSFDCQLIFPRREG